MKRHAGVTLLEMLVALAVFGIVATVLYESFTRTLVARDIAGKRAETFSTARVAFDWLEQDLKGSLSVQVYPTGTARFSSTGHGGEDTLSADEPLLDLTVRTGRRTATVRDTGGEELAGNMTDQARVRYRVEEAAPSNAIESVNRAGRPQVDLELVRYEWRPPLEEPPPMPLRTVVARGVETVDLRFEVGGSILTEWTQRTTATTEPIGPRVVEIRIVLIEADGASAEFSSSVLVPMGGRRG